MPERKLSLDAENHSGKIRCISAAQQSRNGCSKVVSKRNGRPSSRTSRIEAVIFGRIAQGRSLQKICRSRRLPSYTTVTRWLQDDEEFRKKYALARQEQAELLASQLLEIADDNSNDWIETEDGKRFVNHDHINRSRLRIDTRKWIASKLLPKVYGEKPAEVNNNLQIHNHLHITEAQMREVQEARRRFLTAT